MAKIIITNENGDDVTEFDSIEDESIATQVQDHDVPLVIGCGVGACSMCKCKVKKGLEHINPEANGPAQFPIDDDEVLTCIAAVKSDTPDDAEIELEIENA